MYAVIETGGKQYKVAVGDKLKVEKLIADEGTSVELDRVLMVADGENITVGSPVLGTAVSATVLAHGRGDKIRVFKMKRRKNYRRTQGHRQAYTEIEITGIGDEIAAAERAGEESTEKGDSVAPAATADTQKAAVSEATESEATVSEATESQAAEAAHTGSVSASDDLTTINGIGPVISEKLQGLGITTFRQIAEFDQAKIDEVNELLSFKGRIEREEWVDQAKKLIT